MKFKVGDRVRYRPVHGTSTGIVGGDIGTVVESGLAMNYGPGSRVDFGCKAVKFYDDALELVPPDREQTVPWSECYFQPRDLKVTV